MTSLNPLNSPQTTMQDLYNQLSEQAQSNKPGQLDANVTQRFGLPKGLLQDLRHDLKAVLDGGNPDKAVDNLLKGLQKFQAFVSPEKSGSNTMAKEWPAGKELPSDGIQLVKGKDGQSEQVNMAKEWPAGKELPSDGTYWVKGEDGKPKQVSSNESQYLESQASGSVQAKSDNVISNLKKFLDASANGENAGQALEAVRGAIEDLVGSGALANNPEQVRKALMESIRANA